MICLTGDIHHNALKTEDQKYLKGNEVEAALKAAKITQYYGLKYTLFCTGQCVVENSKLLKEITQMENIEIGGHNYYAFKYKLPFKIYKKLSGLSNGPYWFQKLEIKKTLDILNKISGENICSWRDHTYRHDRNTRNILRKFNIKYFSDILCGKFGQPRLNNGIIDVPINTIPDHDYVYHGPRSPGTFEEKVLLQSPFQTKALHKEEWLEKLQMQVATIESFGGIATILVHPACMEIVDDFKTFTLLCKYLSQYQNCTMSEINIKTGNSEKVKLS